MKENENKHIEYLIEDVMKQTALESPSFSFTANVMQQVNSNSKSTLTLYKPLISKTGWFAILISVLALMLSIVFTGNSQKGDLFYEVDLSVLSNLNLFNLFSETTFSYTTLYALLFFGIMVCIQIPLLKNYFDKRLNL